MIQLPPAGDDKRVVGGVSKAIWIMTWCRLYCPAVVRVVQHHSCWNAIKNTYIGRVYCLKVLKVCHVDNPGQGMNLLLNVMLSC